MRTILIETVEGTDYAFAEVPVNGRQTVASLLDSPTLKRDGSWEISIDGKPVELNSPVGENDKMLRRERVGA